MKEFINCEGLKPYFGEDIKKEQLVSLAYNINHIGRQALSRITHEEKKRIEYDKLENAKKAILNAQDALKKAKEGFSGGLFEALIEAPPNSHNHSNTFFSQCEQIIICIPEEKPKSIQKRELESFIEILHLLCEKIDPKIDWYTSSEYKNGKYSGDFFFICKTILQNMELKVSDRTIVSYMQKTSKPNREEMIKNLGS